MGGDRFQARSKHNRGGLHRMNGLALLFTELRVRPNAAWISRPRGIGVSPMPSPGRPASRLQPCAAGLFAPIAMNDGEPSSIQGGDSIP